MLEFKHCMIAPVTRRIWPVISHGSTRTCVMTKNPNATNRSCMIFVFHNEKRGLPSNSINLIFFCTSRYELVDEVALRHYNWTTVQNCWCNSLPGTPRILILTSNNITHLAPCSFSGLTRLETLDISYNRLKHLSLSLFSPCSLSLTKLKILNVSNNKITHVSPHRFCNTPRLKTLDLSWNNIKFISHSMFTGLDSLVHLILRVSYIKMISPAAFSPMPQLSYISLADNNLTHLEGHLFDENPDLRELYLHNNDLATLPATVSEGFFL